MIEFFDVTKTFFTPKGEINALSEVSFSVAKGELAVLKGRSGSGKSTILSLIASLSKPTKGKILVDNEEIVKMSDDFASAFRLKNIGFIFQRYNLFEHLSVYENLLAPLVPLSLDRNEVQRRIEKVLEEFHIESKKDLPAKSLSGGEQQRVAIARALINDPKIILADEPTANLDATLAKEFITILQRLKNDKKTVVVATHDPLFFDLDFVDRVYEVNGGAVC